MMRDCDAICSAKKESSVTLSECIYIYIYAINDVLNSAQVGTFDYSANSLRKIRIQPDKYLAR